MPSPLHALFLGLCGLFLASCGIDAGDMNGSGYRALAFELPDEAHKYFEAARELIAEEVGPDELTEHPEYPRLRVGEILVTSWSDPDAAFAELRAAVGSVDGLLNEKRASLLVDRFTKAERLPEAYRIAEYAAARFPDDGRLAQKRDNLAGRLGEGTDAVPPLATLRATAPAAGGTR